MPNNDHRTPRAEVPSGPHGPNGSSSTVDTVIVGGSDETRLLLRGLLRLHHHRVRGEAATAEGLEPVESPAETRVLILVIEGEGEEWPLELASARDRQPGLRALLIVPESTPQLESRARAAGVHGILNRPFAIRDLIAAVEAVGRGEERFGGPLPQR
jgi:AmiR/NasT family two-component response regulator